MGMPPIKPRWSAERRAHEQHQRALAAAGTNAESTPRLVGRIAVRVVLALAFTWLLWRGAGLGVLGLVIAAPLFGVLLARPLVDLFSDARRLVKHVALAPFEGRHYEHRGIAIDIAEDDTHERWLRVGDVRKVLPGFPRDALLLRQHPQACREDPAIRDLRIQATALLAYLSKASEPTALKFKLWLEREVVYPAQQRQVRSGGRPQSTPQPPAPPAATAPPSRPPSAPAR